MRATATSTSSSSQTQTGMPATMRGAGRPAASAALVRWGTTWEPMARSSAIQRIVPSVRSPASCSIFGPRAAISTGVGATSVMSSGLCTRNSSFSTSTGPGRPAPGRARRGGRAGWRAGVVGQAEHLVDDPVVRHAEAEGEAALADRLHRQRLLGEGDGVAGLHGDDRGADLDAARLGPDERRGGEGVEVVGDLRHPDGGEARPPRPSGRRRAAVRPWSRSGPAPGRPSPRCARPTSPIDVRRTCFFQ